MQKNCLNPKADVQLVDSGKVLAESSKQAISSQASLSNTNNPVNQTVVLGVIAGGILIILVVGILLIRKKRGVPLNGILLLLIPSLLAGSVFVLQNKAIVSAFSLSGAKESSNLTLNYCFQPI